MSATAALACARPLRLRAVEEAHKAKIAGVFQRSWNFGHISWYRNFFATYVTLSFPPGPRARRELMRWLKRASIS